MEISGSTPLYYSTTTISNKSYRYKLMDTLTRTDVEKVREQTGLVIPMTPGAEKVSDFVLGQGAFGKFCVGYCLDTKEYVGMKIPSPGVRIQEKEIEMQWNLRTLKHTLPAIDICQTEQATILIQPLAGLGSLKKLIPLIHKVDPKLKTALLNLLAQDLVDGVAEMHGKGFYHLDIKPDNLVIDSKGHLRIIDFGNTYKLDGGKMDLSEVIAGDSSYLPPEYLISDLSGNLSIVCKPGPLDAWSVGITLLQLFHNLPKSPYAWELLFKVLGKCNSAVDLKNGYEKYCKEHPLPQTSNEIKQLLSHDPTTRPKLGSLSFKVEGKEADLRSLLKELVQEAQSQKETSESSSSAQELPLPHFHTYQHRLSLEKPLLEQLTAQPGGPIVLHGSGGTGKTQLATYLAHHPKVKNRHGFRFWFRGSDDIDYLKAQFVFLARELGLIGEKDPFEKALPALHKYLERTDLPWLIVFDNADESIKPFIPPKGGRVLITTRSSWEGAINVDTMTPEESITLVSHLLDSKNEDIPTLCKELGCLPLALVQASAYIRHSELTVKEYLIHLRSNATPLTSDHPLFGKKLPQSLAQMWELSLKKLGPQALQLLLDLSLLAPSAIPQFLIDKLGDPTPLLKLALIKRDQKESYSLHRLLQKLLKHKLRLQKQDVPRLNHVMKQTYGVYSFDPKNAVESEQNHSLLPHGTQLVVTAESYSPLPQLVQGSLAKTYLWMSALHDQLTLPTEEKRLLLKGLPLAKDEWGDESTWVATFLNNIGECYRSQGMFEEALKKHNEALTVWQKIHGNEHPEVAASLNNIGLCYRSQGEFERALNMYVQALKIWKNVYGEYHPRVATSFNNMCDFYQFQGKFEEALKMQFQALKIEQKVCGEEHPQVALSLNNIAACYQSQGKFEDALKMFSQALKISRKIYGEDHPQVALSLNNVGGCYRSQGKFEDALKSLSQALKIWQKAYGPGHPQVATPLNNIAGCYLSQGKIADALKVASQALKIRQKVYGEEHPDVAVSLNDIGECYRSQGKVEDALKSFFQSLKISQKAFGEDHPQVATSLNNIGECYRSQGKVEDALNSLSQALKIAQKVYGKEHPEVALPLNNIGLCYQSQGKWEDALKMLFQALEILQKVYGENHSQVALSLNNIGVCYLSQGKLEEALKVLNQALKITQTVHGEDHPQVALSLNNIAAYYLSKEKFEDASQKLFQALEIEKKVYGKDHLHLASVLSHIGMCQYKLGKYTEALKTFQESLRIFKKHLPSDHKDITATEQNIQLISFQLQSSLYAQLRTNEKQRLLNPTEEQDLCCSVI